MKKLFAVAILALLWACTSSAQTTYNSTSVQVNIGQNEQATFKFDGNQQVVVQCQMSRWLYYPDIVNAPNVSYLFKVTCLVVRSPDPDHDSNQFTSVIVTSPSGGQAGGHTVTLNNASFSSEQTGMHNQNETLGGSATITVQ